ncbi:SGNH/GDSL hydrolase family protein [Anaerococcus cruorum]|uniref:SGNH/GDSL hydrolase family protein n=1 Tax=Anaerococcus cruorum TaxID=3115617 RepID=A0ABW9MVE0_9FIRM
MKILCLGDSYTEGYLVDKNYTDYLKDKGHEIINLGINGDRTSGMLERFKPIACDIQITFGGTNDTFDRVSPEEIFANIKDILDKSLADKNIVIIPPLMEADESYPRYKEINQTINDYGRLAKSSDITVIDARKIKPSYIDGFHMREDFHKDLANEILKVL